MQQQYSQLPQQQQEVLYHIFNMGFSQWGASFSKSAVTHKSTKMALTQLNKSLAEELKEAGRGYIGVHNLSPGQCIASVRILVFMVCTCCGCTGKDLGSRAERVLQCRAPAQVSAFSGPQE